MQKIVKNNKQKNSTNLLAPYTTEVAAIPDGDGETQDQISMATSETTTSDPTAPAIGSSSTARPTVLDGSHENGMDPVTSDAPGGIIDGSSTTSSTTSNRSTKAKKWDPNAYIAGSMIQKLMQDGNHPKQAAELKDHLAKNMGLKPLVIEMGQTRTPLKVNPAQPKWIYGFKTPNGFEYHGLFQDKKLAVNGTASWTFPFHDLSSIEVMIWNNTLGRTDFLAYEYASGPLSDIKPHAFAASWQCIGCHPGQPSFLNMNRIIEKNSLQEVVDAGGFGRMIFTTNHNQSKAEMAQLLKSSEIQVNFRRACDHECGKDVNEIACRLRKIKDAIAGRVNIDYSKISTADSPFIYGLNSTTTEVFGRLQPDDMIAGAKYSNELDENKSHPGSGPAYAGFLVDDADLINNLSEEKKGVLARKSETILNTKGFNTDEIRKALLELVNPALASQVAPRPIGSASVKGETVDQHRQRILNELNQIAGHEDVARNAELLSGINKVNIFKDFPQNLDKAKYIDILAAGAVACASCHFLIPPMGGMVGLETPYFKSLEAGFPSTGYKFNLLRQFADYIQPFCKWGYHHGDFLTNPYFFPNMVDESIGPEEHKKIKEQYRKLCEFRTDDSMIIALNNMNAKVDQSAAVEKNRELGLRHGLACYGAVGLTDVLRKCKECCDTMNAKGDLYWTTDTAVNTHGYLKDNPDANELVNANAKPVQVVGKSFLK